MITLVTCENTQLGEDHMTYMLIKNGTIIDGSGGEPITNRAILIKGNTIKAIGLEKDMPHVDDVEVIDAHGGFILPGLIDTHVHLMFEQEGLAAKLETPFSVKFYKTINYMRRTLDAGVTSVRDAGALDIGVKEAVEQGLIDGPRMQISVNALTITGGHGDAWMRSGFDTTRVSYPSMPDGVCDGLDDVHLKVREMLRAGADIIKVHATGGVMSPTDHPEFTQFSQEELEIIVREAHFRRGLKVMAHAQGAEGIKNAVRAGIHSIEHGLYLDDEAIELMLKHGTYLVPTLLAPVAVLEQAEENDTIPGYAVEKARESVEAHMESVTKAYESGVKIAMGTDAGVMPHGTNLRELSLMCQAGMTPMEAIVATTKVAAECMGWDDRLGTLHEGKLADIVITSTDPIAHIASLEDTNNIITVIKDGEIVKDLRSK